MKNFYCIIALLLVSCSGVSAGEDLRPEDFSLVSKTNIQREQFSLLGQVTLQTQSEDRTGQWYDGNTRTWHYYSTVQQQEYIPQIQYQYSQPMFMTMPAQQNFGSFCSGGS